MAHFDFLFLLMWFHRGCSNLMRISANVRIRICKVLTYKEFSSTSNSLGNKSSLTMLQISNSDPFIAWRCCLRTFLEVLRHMCWLISSSKSCLYLCLHPPPRRRLRYQSRGLRTALLLESSRVLLFLQPSLSLE